MKILLKRPKEPELAALWDEAKRAVETRAERTRQVMLDTIQYVKDCREAGVEPVYAVDTALQCTCGKRTTCACRMRLPVVDEPGAADEGDE